MYVVELEIANPSGLHARPAAALVQLANTATSAVRLADLADPGREVDAKSILGVLSLGVSCGHRIRLSVDGVDEREIAESLRALVESGLGERPPCAV